MPAVLSSNERWTKLTKVLVIPLIVLFLCWTPVIIGSDKAKKYTNQLPRITFTRPIPPRSPFDDTKVALLIEGRPLPHLAPMMLHFISVVPPEWRFRFYGTPESVAHLNKSRSVRQQIVDGKLDSAVLPDGYSLEGQEATSATFTNLTFYRDLLAPAENLLVFQTDSIMCANSKQNLNDWLQYDWVGASWNLADRFGGNGGLSIRRVSKILTVLENQIRIPGTEPEDVWLTQRMGLMPGAKMANGSMGNAFSGENIYQRHPMGYHTGGSGTWLPSANFGTPELRKEIWDYCPEIKMILNMDAERYIDSGPCPDKLNW